jgi:hypothetical protein
MNADELHSTRWHCQQICQQLLGKRVIAGLVELERIELVSNGFTSENIEELRLLDWLLKPAGEDLTTQSIIGPFPNSFLVLRYIIGLVPGALK